MEKIRNIMQNKVFKITSLILKIIFWIFIILFILVVFLQRFSDNKISLFNYRMFTVISESMKPKYEVGNVLFAKTVKPADIKAGDDISYMGKTGDVAGKVVTHQVVEVIEKNDKYQFKTKGLSNLIEDPIVDENQIYGKVVYKSVVLSGLYKIIGSNVGFYLCIIVPIMLIVGYEIFITLIDREEKRRTKIS